MTHIEAVELKAVERYLLDELKPEDREAFEEHFFDCRECAFDLRTAAAFIDEAKVQLPAFIPAKPAANLKPVEKNRDWFAWLRPAFAMPAFALLLGVIAYQNVAVIPGLRSAAEAPRVLAWQSIHLEARSTPAPVEADRAHGVDLMVDLPQQGVYSAWSFEVYNAQGASVWKSPSTTPDETENGTASLYLPAERFPAGAYSLAIRGVQPSGETTEIRRSNFEIHFAN